MGTIEGREALIDRMDYDYLQVEIINFFLYYKTTLKCYLKLFQCRFASWWQIIANPLTLHDY